LRLFIFKIVGIKTRKYIYICCHWHPQNALKLTTIVCDEKDALEFAFEMEVEFGSQKNPMLKYMQFRSFSFHSLSQPKCMVSISSSYIKLLAIFCYQS
jgi:hypothetical protein